jgi:hypothetical protein
MNSLHEINEMLWIGLGVAVPVLLGGTFWAWWCFGQARRRMESWANEQGFEIVQRKLLPLSEGLGEYFFGGLQAVYYLQVRDRKHELHFGTFRCRGFWVGLFGRMKIRWEPET